MSALAEVKPGGWIVQLTCCGRDNGTYAAATWAEADQFRDDYTSGAAAYAGPEQTYSTRLGGHWRSAIIVAGFEDGAQ